MHHILRKVTFFVQIPSKVSKFDWGLVPNMNQIVFLPNLILRNICSRASRLVSEGVTQRMQILPQN